MPKSKLKTRLVLCSFGRIRANLINSPSKLRLSSILQRIFWLYTCWDGSIKFSYNYDTRFKNSRAKIVFDIPTFTHDHQRLVPCDCYGRCDHYDRGGRYRKGWAILMPTGLHMIDMIVMIVEIELKSISDNDRYRSLRSLESGLIFLRAGITINFRLVYSIRNISTTNLRNLHTLLNWAMTLRFTDFFEMCVYKQADYDNVPNLVLRKYKG